MIKFDIENVIRTIEIYIDNYEKNPPNPLWKKRGNLKFSLIFFNF
jgi:hypothetical protein